MVNRIDAPAVLPAPHQAHRPNRSLCKPTADKKRLKQSVRQFMHHECAVVKTAMLIAVGAAELIN